MSESSAIGTLNETDADTDATQVADEAKSCARVFRYGARPPLESEPVQEQLRGAHRYRNRLVEIEHGRRAKVDALLAKHSPRLAEVEAAIGTKALEADRESGAPAMPATGMILEVEQAEAAVKNERMVGRSKAKRSTSPAAEALREKKAKLSALRKERKELRAALFVDESWKAENEKIEEEDHATRLAARSECGIYWGTYNAVEETAKSFRKGAPPRFRAWRDRRDRLGCQIQGGLSVPDLLGGQDSQLRLVFEERAPRRCDGCMATARRARRGQPEPENARPCTCAAMPPASERRARHAVVWFRIGSTGKGNRIPVWAKIPVAYHRDLPEDATVKVAYVIRRSVGQHEEWSVHFVLTRDSWIQPDRATDGVVGIDVGWRHMPDGSLRVATWSGSDGCEGEIALPAWWLREQRRVEGIRAERDKLMDAAKGTVGAWLREHKEGLPDALKLAATAIHAWRAQGKLGALFGVWRPAPTGLVGEAEVLEALAAWRKRDLHLLAFESHLRQQLQASRQDLYRVCAARLSRRYAQAVVEDMDLRRFHVLPAIEEGHAHEERAAKTYLRDACVSDLRTALMNRMDVRREESQNTTMQCHACKAVDSEWKNRSKVTHVCPTCGAEFDQDLNASRNLVATSVTVEWARSALAPGERWSYAPGPNARRRETEAGWAREKAAGGGASK